MAGPARIHVVVSQCRGSHALADMSTCRRVDVSTRDVPVMVLVKAILECILVMIYNNVLSMHAKVPRGGAKEEEGSYILQ